MDQPERSRYLEGPFVLEGLHKMAEEARASGRRVLDLSLGSPAGRPPEHVLKALEDALHRHQPNAHRRSPVGGLEELRQALAEWYERRFVVHLDPRREILPTSSGLEALHLVLADLHLEGGGAMLPSPCPPSWISAVALAGATPHFLPLKESKRWRPGFDDAAREQARASRTLLLGSAHDPTGAVCGLDCLRDAVAFCRENELLLIHEIRWSEFGLAEGVTPVSVLQLPGARECALEISTPAASHRLSGWAPGFIVGDEKTVGRMRQLAGHRGPGPFLAVQRATAAALTGDDAFLADQRRELRLRQGRLCEGLERMGWKVPRSEATIFLWATLPEGHGSEDRQFVEKFFEATEVLLAPGSAFGPGGVGHVRLSLSLDSAGIDACLSSIEESGFLSPS